MFTFEPLGRELEAAATEKKLYVYMLVPTARVAGEAAVKLAGHLFGRRARKHQSSNIGLELGCLAQSRMVCRILAFRKEFLYEPLLQAFPSRIPPDYRVGLSISSSASQRTSNSPLL